jgi:anthranilate 1,2-dioxygenase small subunit
MEAQARSLLADYAAAIDDGPLAGWPSLFTELCLYRITTRRNHERGMPLSIMLCDNQAMLFDRVEAIEQANIFEPHVYRHILSDSRVVGELAGGLRIETSFICVRTMLNGDMCLFAAGRYLDDVVLDGGACRYRAKQVVLDSSRIDTLIAIPL